MNATKVKICGITNLEDAQLAVRLGADMLGFNFYEKSKRYITLERATKISEHLDGSIMRIGVFVGSSVNEITEAQSIAGLDGIQLHGAESPNFVKKLREKVDALIIKAVRVHSEHYLTRLDAFGADAILLDSYSDKEFGGTGETFDWSIVPESSIRVDQIFLAGGLNAENVADAIRMVQPYAVDVASGVESSPGKKDPAKLEAFIRNAKNA